MARTKTDDGGEYQAAIQPGNGPDAEALDVADKYIESKERHPGDD